MQISHDIGVNNSILSRINPHFHTIHLALQKRQIEAVFATQCADESSCRMEDPTTPATHGCWFPAVSGGRPAVTHVYEHPHTILMKSFHNRRKTESLLPTCGPPLVSSSSPPNPDPCLKTIDFLPKEHPHVWSFFELSHTPAHTLLRFRAFFHFLHEGVIDFF